MKRYYGLNDAKANEIANNGFKFEQKQGVIVNNFERYAMYHRPDAVLELDKKTDIAFEIKKGNSGEAIRRGLGQALTYSTTYSFVLYFFIDTTKGRQILHSSKSDEEKELIKSLWDNYNINFIVV